MFSYLGLQTKKVEVNDLDNIEVVMISSDVDLDEVIVVGYSSESKRNLTGSVLKIERDLLSIEQPNSIEKALKGKFAGVQIINSDGAPGSGVSIKVRGANSITAGTAPLYVVDGIPYPVSDDPLQNPLSNLAPGDIENITILKDVASTAIYGAEGANGVILITTVRAKFNQSQWNLKTAIGFSNITKSLPMMSPEDYMSSMMMEFYMRNQYRRDEVDFYQEYADQIWNTAPHRFKNYEDEVMKTSIRNTYDLSFNGGSDMIKNATFLSYMSDDGIAINTGFNRLYLKSNSFVKASQKITFDANLQYSRTERLGLHWSADGNGGIFNEVASFSPLIPKEWTFSEVDDKLYYTNGTFDNPYRKLNDIDVSEVRGSFTGYLGFNYNFGRGLNLKLSASQSISDTKYQKYVPTTIRSSYENSGEAEFRDRKDRYYYYLAQLNYGFSFLRNHRVSLLGGFEMKGNMYEIFQQSYNNFDTDLGIYGVQLATSGDHVKPPQIIYNDHRMSSGFLSINYNYNDKYIIKSSLRADASSRFGPNNKWGFFPATAIAWRISDEQFYKKNNILKNYMPNAKLRLSLGRSGNNLIENYMYTTSVSGGDRNFVSILDPNDMGNTYVGQGGNITAMYFPRIPNPNISWETTSEINFGLDVGLFQDKLDVSLDIYSRTTSDMLLNQELTMISGFPSQLVNIGELGAKGIELSVNSNPIQTEDFNWNVAFNISSNKTKILSLGNDSNQILTGRFIGRSDSENVLIKEGFPLGLYFGMHVEGIRNTYESNSNSTNSNTWWFANEREAPYGFISFADIDGDGSVELSDRFPLAHVDPLFIGGFNQQFTYKNFSLGMSFNWSYGNDIINSNFYSLASQSQGINNKLEILNRGAYFGNQRDGYYVGPGPVYWTAAYRETSNSELVEDGSFFRMTNLSIGYSVPRNILDVFNIKSLNILYTVDNVFTLTRYSGYNPEVNTGFNVDTRLLGGVDYSSYPLSSTHSLSLNFNF